MTDVAERPSHLLPRFQQFYSELTRLAEQIESNPSLAQDAVSQTLGDLLERQGEEARASVDPMEFEVYREAQYVMAALADELFQQRDGKGALPGQSLELRLFRASAAGELFFRKLDWLLQHNDAIHLELAQIYFFALLLGFRGKYRNGEETDDLARYQQKLFVMIFGKSPQLYREKTDLIPLAAPQPVPEDMVLRLPSPRLWMALPAAVLLLWVAVSFVLWGRLTRPVKAALETGVTLSNPGGH